MAMAGSGMGRRPSSSTAKSGKNKFHRTESSGSTGVLARQLSMLSSKTLKTVEGLVNQFGIMEDKVLEIENMLSGDEVPTRDELCIARDALAQTVGERCYGVRVRGQGLELGLYSLKKGYVTPLWFRCVVYCCHCEEYSLHHMEMEVSSV